MAFSLPYGLKINDWTNGYGNREITGLDLNTKYPIKIYGGLCKIENCKPILHPISDLTKEIEHGGEKFVPTEIINDLASDISPTWFIYDEDVEKINWMLQPFYIVQKLIELHFDIAGLIESGEAINVNTLETNPYK